MTKTTIPRSAGIDICLYHCPFPKTECIGDQNCEALHEAVIVAKQRRKTEWRDTHLRVIEAALLEVDYLLSAQIANLTDVTTAQVHALVNQGHLIGEKIGTGRNTLRVTGVVWKS
ncbi:MAG: hypothetical protein GY743_23485 [Planctomycetaceae bacterium]|nr:hypothetical protein [Planctomycetaceae bacterium]